MVKKQNFEVSEPAIDQLLSEIGDMVDELAKSDKSMKAKMHKDEKDDAENEGEKEMDKEAAKKSEEGENAGEKEMDKEASAKKSEKKADKKMKKANDPGEWSDRKGEDKKASDSSKDMTAEMSKDEGEAGEWSDRKGEDKKRPDSSKDMTAEMTKDEEDGSPAPDMDGQDQGCDEGLAQDSDEELHEIYSCMEPAELERHYMIIRSLLAGHYGEEGQEGGGEEAPPPQAEGQGSDMQMSEKKAKAMEKSEKSEVTILKQQLESTNAQLETLVKAMETAFKPARKAVTGVEWIRKSGYEKEEGSKPASSNLSKDQKKEKIRGLSKSEKSKLTSDDRQAITEFFLTGDQEQKIDQIIESVGGNK